MRTLFEGDAQRVIVRLEVDGGDVSLDDGWWGYYLERGRDGRWHIVDAGVA